MSKNQLQQLPSVSEVLLEVSLDNRHQNGATKHPCNTMGQHAGRRPDTAECTDTKLNHHVKE